MRAQHLDTGLYWRPLGGNNIDQISGHSFQYTYIDTTATGYKADTIIVDLGKFDNHQALGIKNSAAAVPDIRELLQSSEFKAKAIFLTHSHPDHLNGIVHYLKAGFKLPPLVGGRYTRLILQELYQTFGVLPAQQPPFVVVTEGNVMQCGALTIEVLPASHTCFDSFGFYISCPNGVGVYHTGDMKLDDSTYFRRPTDQKRLQKLASQIDFVVADFCGICAEGFAVREADTFKTLSAAISERRRKIFVPVYPTHTEMYLVAFLAALKCRRNVIFYGDDNFYGYLSIIKEYGIDFSKLARDRIKVSIGIPEDLSGFGSDYVIVGTYNDIGGNFAADASNACGIITSGSYFNPLRGQFNIRGIPFVDVKDFPVLQGCGHGFIGDYERLNRILAQPKFIPMHCPLYVIDSCRALAQYIGLKIAEPTARNNHLYRLDKDGMVEVSAHPAVWLVVSYVNDEAVFTEVWQRPTSGHGFLKRTFSARRCRRMFRIMLYRRRQKEKQNARD